MLIHARISICLSIEPPLTCISIVDNIHVYVSVSVNVHINISSIADSDTLTTLFAGQRSACTQRLSQYEVELL